MQSEVSLRSVACTVSSDEEFAAVWVELNQGRTAGRRPLEGSGCTLSESSGYERMTASAKTLLRTFRIVYFAAALFCLIDAGLILVSLPLADQPHVSDQAVIVSITVATAVLAAAFLVLRISFRLSNLYLLILPGSDSPALVTNLRGLLTSMITAGLVLAAITGLVAFGLLARIREGFAVFG